jgi:PEP-CTERM motif
MKYIPLTVLFLATLATAAEAAAIYSDNFESDTSANYNVNQSGGNNAATFAFDYSTVGIPAAPNSGGTTKGLKLEANYQTSGQVQSGISVSPTGLSLTGDFDIRFDLWENSIGPFTGLSGDGGSGSTQVTSYGWGTAGTTAQWAGSSNSVMFGATGDGNSSFDWRVYKSNALVGATDSSYVAVAGAGNDADLRNNIHSYYSTNFPGVAPPAAQLGLFASQTGAPQNGSAAFQWFAALISKRGNTLTWSLDGVPIANVDMTGLTLGGDNFFLGQFDINAGASSSANARSLIFGLIDNLEVTQVPEPSSLMLLVAAAAAGLIGRRRQ